MHLTHARLPRPVLAPAVLRAMLVMLVAVAAGVALAAATSSGGGPSASSTPAAASPRTVVTGPTWVADPLASPLAGLAAPLRP